MERWAIRIAVPLVIVAEIYMGQWSEAAMSATVWWAIECWTPSWVIAIREHRRRTKRPPTADAPRPPQ